MTTKVILEIETDSIEELRNQLCGLSACRPSDTLAEFLATPITAPCDGFASHSAGLLDRIQNLRDLTDLISRFNPVLITDLVVAVKELLAADQLRDKIIHAMGVAAVMVKFTTTEADDNVLATVRKLLDTPYVLDVFITIVQKLLGGPSAKAVVSTEDEAVFRAQSISLPVLMELAQFIVMIIRMFIHAKE